MSSTIFIFYRIFEKIFKIRLESFIGYIIFWFHGLIFNLIKRQSLININDKRTLWDDLRFDNLNINSASEIKNSMTKAISYGKISFENSMETSIRAINLITIIDNNNFTKSELVLFNFYLRLAKLNVILCPDLYIKKFKLNLKDESNNHRFYNLLFNQYYNYYFSYKVSIAKIESFVKKRSINNNFYDEGSSFYHFGIIDSLIKLKDFISDKCSDCFSPRLNMYIDESAKILNAFSKLNFGDRDDTIINKNFKQKIYEKYNNSKVTLNNPKWFLKSNKNKYIFFRRENWTKLGTNGHVHDDSGNFLISDGVNSIYDLGTFKYSNEPKYCKATFHNFPYTHSIPEMDYKSKFERLPNKELLISEQDNKINLSKSNKLFTLTRVFDTNDYKVEDYLFLRGNSSVNITWTFFVSDNCIIYEKNPRQNELKIKNFCNFYTHPFSQIKITNDFFFPNYGKKINCKKIMIFLNHNFKSRKRIKIFSLETKFKI